MSNFRSNLQNLSKSIVIEPSQVQQPQVNINPIIQPAGVTPSLNLNIGAPAPNYRPVSSSSTYNATPRDTGSIFSNLNVNTNSALLMIGPRRRLAPQIVRPIVYSFDNTFLNSLNMMLDDTPVPSIRNIDINALRAVGPAFQGGVELDMGLFQEGFSFILCITETSSSTFREAPGVITILSGYFLDEPMFNNVPNELAKFIITNKTSVTHGTNAISNLTGSNNHILTLDKELDVITSDLASYTKEGDHLFWNTLSDISTLPATPAMKNNTGHLSRLLIKNMGHNNRDKKEINRTISIPVPVIDSIVNAAKDWHFDRLYPETSLMPIPSSSINEEYFHSIENTHFNNELMKRIPPISLNMSNNINWNNGLDTTIIHTLRDLLQHFKDSLRIINVKLNNPNVVAGGMEIDQTVNTKQNQFSYLVSYTIGPIASAHGLLGIHFEYYSNLKGNTLNPSMINPGWVILKVSPIGTLLSDAQLKANIKNFQRSMEDNVFSTIKAFIGGDFSVRVSYERGGNIQIDLNLLDYQSAHQKGLYEAYDHISNFTNPTFAGYEVINSNKLSLEHLQNAISSM